MKQYQLPLLFAAVSLFLIGLAQADEAQRLRGLRFDFQVKLAEMIKPLRELDEKYGEHLEKQKQNHKNSGQLEAMLAVDEELKWLKGKPVEENPSKGSSLSSFPDLKRLQEIYRKQWAALEDKSALPDKKLVLIQSYRKKSSDLSVEWTKEGKITEAKLALAESKRFAAMEKNAELAANAGRSVASGPALRTGKFFAGKNAGDEMKNGIQMKLCWIPAGKFTMGSPKSEPERDAEKEAQVEVELTRGFWMGKYEVTQKEYEKVVGSNPAKFIDVGRNAPVEQVSWNDCLVFCKKLTELERKSGKLPEGWTYTLPTEAQWEYACRAGERGPYSGGALDEVGWYKNNSRGKTHEVGEKKANAWGLHDAHGNVREWCLDWISDKMSGGENPTGPTSGINRIHRGGYWNFPYYACRNAYRSRGAPSSRNSSIGFRITLISTR